MSKIDGFGQKSLQVDGGSRGSAVERPSQAERGADATGATRGDAVTLTDGARQLQRLAEAVAAAPATSEARVQAVKQSIASGEYQVDARRVADKIVQAERGLVGR